MSASQLAKVFVSRVIPPVGVDMLRQSCQVNIPEGETSLSRKEFLQSISGMDALLITPGFVVDKEALDAAGPQLKVVSTFSVGLDHIDLDLCKERGVKVGHTPDVLTAAVAEHAICLTLTAARRFKESIHTVHEGVWGTQWQNCLWLAGKEISGSVVGIVGLGRIGLAIAKRLAAFEVSKIVYTSRSPKPETAGAIGAEYASLDQLLQQSDFVIAACSMNDSNVGLFNEEAFGKMKPTSVFVNVARGSLLDQEALYKALNTGKIGAAGLDVTSPEPLPASHPLLGLTNCVVTPHIGSDTDAAINSMCDLVVDNVLAGLGGRPLKTPAY